MCKDDLICLPRKTAIAMGNFGPLVLCLQVRDCCRCSCHPWFLHVRIIPYEDWPTPLQVTSQIKLICPLSLRLVDVPGKECVSRSRAQPRTPTPLCAAISAAPTLCTSDSATPSPYLTLRYRYWKYPFASLCNR